MVRRLLTKRTALPLLAAVLGLSCVAAPASQAPSPPALRVAGTQFVGDRGDVYIPRWVSGLTLLVRSPEQQAAFLDWARDTGFNGVRVFGGALTWANQTSDGARAALPALLDRAAARGLVVEVTALTDTGAGYDARVHLRGIVDIVADRRGVVLELANEVGNPTQSADLTPERLRAWGQELATPRGVVWAVGAGDADHPVNGRYQTHGGSYITAHLDRGGAMWPQVARVRALFEIVETHGVPVINNEPMGADERPGRETGRQRWNEPAGFFTLGVLDRAFGLGGVHHSQAGLMAELPGPIQQQCAEAYVEGHRAVAAVLGSASGTSHDAGESGSPVVSYRREAATVVYAFTSEARGVIVIIGATGDPAVRLANGWRQTRVVATMAAADGARAEVVEISRSAVEPPVR